METHQSPCKAWLPNAHVELKFIYGGTQKPLNPISLRAVLITTTNSHGRSIELNWTTRCETQNKTMGLIAVLGWFAVIKLVVPGV